ncbi:Uma2 family endonuclease [Luteolibacter flavescens]|uniref:Uma2 family endonuclease n=1 Tax=Luteolibacter flavescens TaxID=1859460 RepID=A0ABT3FI53_9BACT|nr:Uma2 family endonuclease [Luteolibacter flavescens]MCW1883246.1 Uma2 family endonuclease [Luteolibacter flavescens]
MTALRKPLLVSVADYLAAEEDGDAKHEYLGGVVHAMAGGTARHNAISSNILGALVARLRGKPCQPFNSDMKLRVELADQTRFYYPDAMVVCEGKPDHSLYQDQPSVIVEVLSDSTRRIDLTEKRDAYLTIASVRHLIFVEPDEARVIVYRRRETGDFETGEHVGLDAVIELPEIEAQLPLAELYERLTF